MTTALKTWLALGQHLLRAAMVATALPALAAGSTSTPTPIDLNRADAATLARGLVGIGPAKAQAIVAYRQQHGSFKSVDELALVKGIGPRTLERNRSRLRVKDTTPARKASPQSASATPSRARRALPSPAD